MPRVLSWLRQWTESFLTGAAGVTLLEVVVSVFLLGLGGVTVAGGIAAGLRGADRSNVRSVLSLLAQSQLDDISVQPFSAGGAYQLFPQIAPGFDLSIQVTTLRPGLLQEITALASRTGESPLAVTTFKSNRLLETGARPGAAGLEGFRRLSFPLSLNPGEGLFQVVQVAPTESPGNLRARWQLKATPPLGVAGEARTLSLTIFNGTPFGTGPAGISSLLPSQVAASIRASGETTDLVLEVLSSGVSPGFYTLYFFNKDVLVAQTEEATAECICP